MATSPPQSSTDVPTDECVISSIRHMPSHVRFWLIGGAVLWLDLWSKAWIFSNLPPNTARSFIQDVLVFHRSLNDGAVFGSFTGQVGLFIAASIFALGFVLYLFARTPSRSWVMQTALALVLAGALGNLYDRAVVKADVVQFKAPNGTMVTRIGKIVDQSEHTIHLGDWPEGTNVQPIRRSEAEVRRQGVVRDFLRFTLRFPSWFPKLAGREVWPWVFNIADAALVIGVGVLLLSSWTGRHPSEQDRG